MPIDVTRSGSTGPNAGALAVNTFSLLEQSEVVARRVPKDPANVRGSDVSNLTGLRSTTTEADIQRTLQMYGANAPNNGRNTDIKAGAATEPEQPSVTEKLDDNGEAVFMSN